MNINTNHNSYYVFSSIYANNVQITYGACPLIWHDQVVLRGGEWQSGLTWADGNYHLLEFCGLMTDEALFIEECIYLAINEAQETSGTINEFNYTVRWCIMDEEQINIVMNLECQ